MSLNYINKVLRVFIFLRIFANSKTVIFRLDYIDWSYIVVSNSVISTDLFLSLEVFLVYLNRSRDRIW